MSINALINELKENNEDFEFYPTTNEMLEVIVPYLDDEIVLDIGCGTCKFKKYMENWASEETRIYNQREDRKEKEALLRGEKYYKNYKSESRFRKIKKYYVIEKSRVLLKKLDEDTICLGTNFNETMLIDKKVSTIFCNPPYSEFEEWTKKIISEGNYKQAFLVIPQRWKDDIYINNLLKRYDTTVDVLGSFDFLDAERRARAKVDVLRLRKTKYINKSYSVDAMPDFEEDAFNIWFNDTFGLENKEKNNKVEREYERNRRIEEEKTAAIKNALVSSEDSKAKILVDLYNEEYNKLINNLKLIMQLDDEVLETFGFSVAKVKEGLKVQIKGLKIIYWNMVFDEFKEITSRLTSKTRNKLKETFTELQTIDFNIENIYAMILWVIKNANKYYNSQLIDFFKDLSEEENVKPYKSNQRLFENDGYRWNYKRDEKRDYVLDYRIIMSNPFRISWSGKLETDSYDSDRTLLDIFTIAKNLGFEPLSIIKPKDFGEKCYIYLRKGTDVFMEYKVYKNGNMHVKFNKEFTKALNVEVSRLLGWIRCKEDIAREFPEEIAKGAEKYFKSNYILLENNSNLLLLTSSAT